MLKPLPKDPKKRREILLELAEESFREKETI